MTIAVVDTVDELLASDILVELKRTTIDNNRDDTGGAGAGGSAASGSYNKLYATPCTDYFTYPHKDRHVSEPAPERVSQRLESASQSAGVRYL